MKYFAASMIASAISARGSSGGINQGYANSSTGGQHGYGYNMGNDYISGDSHGQVLGHQDGTGYGQPVTGQAYTANNVHDHIYGYDSVKPMSDSDWLAAVANQATLRGNIATAITAASDARVTFINGVLARRKIRLEDIHQDNILKIEAPFDF